MWKRVITGLLLTMFVAACAGNETRSEQNRTEATDSRQQVFDRSKARFPVPYDQMANFPLRGALVDMSLRQDQINHPWYTYLMGDNGNMIGYYVTKTVPINACNFLSTGEEITESEGTDLITQAPSIDGMFYGDSTCEAWFAFDSTTNALIQFSGFKFFSVDQPLLLDAEPIQVAE